MSKEPTPAESGVNRTFLSFRLEFIPAIREGRKTQTRRVIKSIAPEWELNPILERVYTGVFEWDKHPWPWRMTNPKQKYNGRFGVFVQYQTDVDDYATTFIPCPYGAAGDQLWVRETWQTRREWDHLKPSLLPEDADLWWPANWASHRALNAKPGKNRPSIFMPRWASRITLEVERVWVERVQDISDEDADAEGIFNESGKHLWYCDGQSFSPDQQCACGERSPHEEFADLWDSINAKRGYGWDINPWCWCIEFSNLDRRHK